ncbi:hypothetical protein ACO0RG_001982 [Hanseniaspora osmophila]|uniref:OTU domain-containing protein 2 n=1 Tax=Hanseniaspora osmophila TaxID=56408 RepID=A0A1E5RGU6_9ASCO|nr:OTU domain-containing protein 2 [Hanseniaspora osmophila]
METEKSDIESKECLLARHKKEKKDLQNQVTGMKKQSGGNKSKRKQINSKCAELEESLQKRHEQEVREWEKFHGLGETSIDDDNEDDDEFSPEKLLKELEIRQKEEEPNETETSNASKQDSSSAQQAQPKKRRNRQREKLAKREAEIAKIKEEAAKEAMEQPDLKKMEQDTLDKIFAMNNVRPYDIQPDGHCLFASILDQLQTRHVGKKNTEIMEHYNIPNDVAAQVKQKPIEQWNVADLRSLAANHVREHKDNFIPYLFDEATMSLLDINDYTEEIEKTAKWGGDVELIALANVFNCCISIIFSGRSTLKINDLENEQTPRNPELKLVYYKHTYALGEHYNSLRDA